MFDAVAGWFYEMIVMVVMMFTVTVAMFSSPSCSFFVSASLK
jgi:hypothetical protein